MIKLFYFITLLLLPLSLFGFSPNGQGNIEAYISIIDVDKDIVQSILSKEKDGLVLMNQSLTTKKKHPIVLIFGTHRNVGFASSSRFINIVSQYYEYSILIPYVGILKNNRLIGPLSYMPTLYLNSQKAIMLGHLYGFNKYRADFNVSESENKYDVLSSDYPFEEIVRLEYEKTAVVSKDSFIKNRSRITKFFKHPLVNIRDGFFSSSFQCAQFDWLLDDNYSNYESFGPYQGIVDLAKTPFYLGEDTIELNGLDKALTKSLFRVKSDWKLGLPYPCE